MLRLLSLGFMTLLVGMGSNLAAQLANEGHFPEFAPGTYPGYVDAHRANLAWLGDWMPIGNYWFSPGDFFIYGGLALVAVAWVMLIRYGLRTGRWSHYIRDLQDE